MGDLGVKYTITVHLKLADKGACILAEIMENFDNFSILQDRLETKRERVDFHEIENKTFVIEKYQ